MDFLNNLNLNKNELQNAVVQKLDVAPVTPVDGQVYFSTASDTLFVRAGGAWVDALKQGDVTGVTSATPSTLSVTDGTGPVPSIGIITAAIEAGGEGLATAGQIVDYVASISSGVVSVSSGDTDRITIGGTASAPTVDANTAAIADGGVNLATGDQIHTFITDFGYTTNTGTVTSVSAGDGIALSGTGTVDPTISVKLSSATNYIEIAPVIEVAEPTDKIAYSNADDEVKKITFGKTRVTSPAASSLKVWMLLKPSYGTSSFCILFRPLASSFVNRTNMTTACVLMTATLNFSSVDIHEAATIHHNH